MSALSTNVFVVDTNILFQFDKWLPIELNNVFWSKLENALTEGKWILLDKVVEEVTYNGDLKKWCDNQKKKGLVEKIDDAHKMRAIEINNAYKMIDEATKRSTVDTFLIAYAEAMGYAVFSLESYRSLPTDLYKIPDVCKALNIPCIKKPIIFLKAIGHKN